MGLFVGVNFKMLLLPQFLLVVDIWDSVTLVIHTLGTYDLVMFKVIWESFSTFVSKWPVTRKWLVIENESG